MRLHAANAAWRLPSDADIMSPLWENIMKAILNLVKDEQGGEVLEYALIAGLIVVAAIAVIGSVGGKVLARWNSLNSSM
jgi:Flp pilus assembly pilin Flp